MFRYGNIVQEHVVQHTAITNEYADIVQDISKLKQTADKLNQENLSLKKILYDICPMVEEYELVKFCDTKYSDLIKSIIQK